MYKSRLPRIARKLPFIAEAITKRTTEAIAKSAAERAPVGATGELKKSIEARSAEFDYGARSEIGKNAASLGLAIPSSRGMQSVQAYGVWAAWYWFFVEYGTSRQGAQPFITPAVEEHRATAERYGRTLMGRL